MVVYKVGGNKYLLKVFEDGFLRDVVEVDELNIAVKDAKVRRRLQPIGYLMQMLGMEIAEIEKEE